MVEKTVQAILKGVERGGDQAILRYTKQFDKVALKPDALRVTPEEVKNAYFHIRKDEGDALRLAAQRITSFHERQRTKTWMYQDGDATLGQLVGPVDAVGVYIPGGKAVYPSSVLMCAIPAKVAGVSRIVMVTPPQKDGINPYLLVAADIAGVTEIYRVGGVQASRGPCLWDEAPSRGLTRSLDQEISTWPQPSDCSMARLASTWWPAPVSC